MSFKENFSRGEEEDMLEYDDGAFYYFSLALVTFVALPYTWYLIKTLIWGDVQLEEFSANCQCSHCTALINVKKKQLLASRYSRKTFFRCLVGALIWYIWLLNFTTVSTMKPLQSFDPYAILDLPSDATANDIKKKFRKMSLLLHPDKNPDNPLAVQEFIKLTKAYNVSLSKTTSFADPHRRRGERELSKVWKPGRTRHFLSGYRDAQVPPREGQPHLGSASVLLHSPSRGPRLPLFPVQR